MRTLFTYILLTAGLTAAAQQQLPGRMHFGLIYPISSNGNHAPADTNNLSISLLAGVSASEQGLAFAGLSNVVRHNARAVLFAGFSNHISGTAKGAQFAGFINTAGNLNGAQFAGFANIADTVKGAQFAGYINVAGKKMTESQFAGFINVAQDIEGSQFAGFINIAKKVKGVQLAGFINVADSSDFPVGIINIVKKGEKGIGATFDDSQTGMLSFRSGGRVLYGIIGIGYNYQNTDEVYAFEAGFGAHVLRFKPFRFNIEVVAQTLESFREGEFFKASLRAMPALKVAPWLEVFGGPSFNYITTNTIEGIMHKDRYERQWANKWGSDFQAIYFGYQGGIQIIF